MLVSCSMHSQGVQGRGEEHNPRRTNFNLLVLIICSYPLSRCSSFGIYSHGVDSETALNSR